MISNPQNGWGTFELDNFKGPISYIQDVPIDLLEAFYESIRNDKIFAYEFDQEGKSFVLVVTDYESFIIENSEILHRSEKTKLDLANELVKDIEKDVEGWTDFLFYDTEEKRVLYKQAIIKNLNRLKKLLK